MQKGIIKVPYLNTGFLGGHLLGEIEITYKELRAKLGKQNQETDGYKTDAEWLVFTDVGFARIYNYKSGKNYNGRDGLALRDITNWHIGGENPAVVEIIKSYLLA